MKRFATTGSNSYARYGLKGHSVSSSFHTYRGGVRR